MIEVKNQAVSPTPAFVSWCEKELVGHKTAIDVPSFVNFLWEIESESDVKAFATETLVGSSGNVFNFVREFVDRRKAIMQRTGAPSDDIQIDDDDFQVKASAKSKKKGKFTKVSASLLNFKTEPPPMHDDQ